MWFCFLLLRYATYTIRVKYAMRRSRRGVLRHPATLALLCAAVYLWLMWRLLSPEPMRPLGAEHSSSAATKAVIRSTLPLHPLHSSTGAAPISTQPLQQKQQATTTQRPTPVASTQAASRHTAEPATTLEFCDPHGVNLGSKDPAVASKPGGTELEALRFRRQLSEFQSAHDLDHIRWRSLPGTSEVPSEATCLGRVQAQLSADEQRQLYFHRASVEPHACGPFDLSCRISAYAEMTPRVGSDRAMCDSVYGADLIKRFRTSQTEMCTASHKQRNASLMRCHMIQAHQSHEAQTSICYGENIAVNFKKISNGDFPWLKFHQGALELACDDTPSATMIRSAPGTFIHCLADWMELGYHAAGRQSTAACDETVDVATYFVTRSGDYSPFALTHDWLNSIILMAAEKIDLRSTQIVMMDRMTTGFYTPVWSVAFSPELPLQWYPDLAEAAAKHESYTVCYRKAWFNIPARLSPVYNEDECGHDGGYQSPVYHVYRDHLLSRFRALSTVGAAAPRRHAASSLIVTLIMRRNYATGHSIGRRIANADEVSSLLRSMSVGNDVDVVVNQVDFAAHNFDAQLNISRATDLLVAMHGAGLAQMMFQHVWGGVFEFFCPEKPSSNYRYRQLANKMGLLYDSYSIVSDTNIVSVAEAAPLLTQLAVRVAAKKREALSH